LRGSLPFRLGAIHVDHGIHPSSREWSEHCRRVCARLQVEFTSERVEPGPAPHRAGPEAAARRARYALLAKHLAAGEILLTAHHRDDQAETVLHQLLRGSGLSGLSGMPALARFARGWHARPLLGFRRRALVEYARHEGLSWIEDSSNLDTRLARNFLRHRVLPLLEQRWPATVPCLARSADHAAEGAAVLDELGRADLRRCLGVDGALSLRALRRLEIARRRNALRHWIRAALGKPPQAHELDEILSSLAADTRTRHAAVTLAHGEVRRYRDQLWLLGARHEKSAGTTPLAWDPATALPLPGGGELRAVKTLGAGLGCARLAGRSLDIRFRAGGERVRRRGSETRQSVKKLLQESGMPPWQRACLPLVHVDGILAAVGDRWTAAEFAARAGEPGWVLVIDRRPDPFSG
jgi:tRNA(Ile)-lysidine synthase